MLQQDKDTVFDIIRYTDPTNNYDTVAALMGCEALHHTIKLEICYNLIRPMMGYIPNRPWGDGTAQVVDAMHNGVSYDLSRASHFASDAPHNGRLESAWDTPFEYRSWWAVSQLIGLYAGGGQGHTAMHTIHDGVMAKAHLSTRAFNGDGFNIVKNALHGAIIAEVAMQISR